MALLELQDVSYTYETKTILNNMSISIYQGDFISIVGPSGSGKSTFLKLCSHLISPTSGNIIYKGVNLMHYNPIELRKNIAYCFQTPCLFGDKVIDNMKFPFAIRNSKINLERVHKLFSLFNVDKSLLDADIKNLSGGEKQRIALIRILLFEPEVLLLDEVTSALDIDNSLIVENAIKSLNKNGITILWITHNPEQSRKNANKLLTIENGEIKQLEVLR